MLTRKYALLLMVAVILITTACGSNSNRNATTETVVIVEEPINQNKDKTIITYARKMDETDATDMIIERYNEQSDSVYVISQELAYDSDTEYEQIITSLSQEGAIYDIIEANIAWMAEFADKDYIESIENYIEADVFDIKAYEKNAIETSMYREKLWGLPKNISTNMLYYRTDLIEKLPETWEELAEIAYDAKQNNDIDFGYVMPGKISSMLVVEAAEAIYSHGGKIVDDNGKMTINSEEAVEGLNKIYEIYNSDYVPKDIANQSQEDVLVSFMNGKSVFMYNSMNCFNILKQKNSLVSGVFDAIPLPGGATTITSSIMLMNKASLHKEAVWDFMKFAAGYEGQKIDAIFGNRFPTITSVLEDDAVAEIGFPNQNFANAKPTLKTPYYKELTDVMRQQIFSFLNSKQDAQETVEAIEKHMNNIISTQ